MNVPSTVAIVVASRLATLYELETVYGVKDLYDLFEISVVDKFNQRQLERP